ncbi:hypothetical protein R1flu_012678 [Riccia fluitans]|uniref:Uncharacterized protein n=1 Tax=Riccia fluitans TaxID=41844 RepID=A0ABD1ZBM9_9MARC
MSGEGKKRKIKRKKISNKQESDKESSHEEAADGEKKEGRDRGKEVFDNLKEEGDDGRRILTRKIVFFLQLEFK